MSSSSDSVVPHDPFHVLKNKSTCELPDFEQLRLEESHDRWPDDKWKSQPLYAALGQASEDSGTELVHINDSVAKVKSVSTSQHGTRANQRSRGSKWREIDIKNVVEDDIDDYLPTKSTSNIDHVPRWDCTICDSLCEVLQGADDQVHHIGNYADANALDCTWHTPLLSYLKESCSLSLKDLDQSIIEAFAIHKHETCELVLNLNVSVPGRYRKKTRSFDLITSPEQHVPRHSIGRLRQRPWLPLKYINELKRRCSCPPSPFANSGHRARLMVNTRRMCLERVISPVKYIALSYVWGQVDTVRTLSSNLDAFLGEGALSRPDIISRLPKTITDAMWLTRNLNERYLWVDTLCIVQDDAIFKHAEIQIMSSIYSDAFLVIIAAGGNNADHGIVGLKETLHAEARKSPACFIIRNGWALGVHSKNFTVEGTPWSQRGWTYQEGMLAYRTITLTDEHIEWRCHCTRWEDTGTVSTVKRRIEWEKSHSEWAIDRHNVERLLKATWPDYVNYALLVHQYTSTQLTYPEDIRDAFVGITNRLCRAFQTGFLFGLPAMFFDLALLWTHVSNCRTRRRVFSGKSCPKFPSWSWMGWFGTVSNDESSIWAPKRILADSTPAPMNAFELLAPLVKWFYVDDGNRYSISNNWYDHAVAAADIQSSCPAGWTRHPDNMMGGYLYSHKVFEYSTCQAFSDWQRGINFPIPMSSPMDVASVAKDVYLIACAAHRCWLHFLPLRAEDVGSDEDESFHVQLRDTSWTIVGHLQLSDTKAVTDAEDKKVQNKKRKKRQKKMRNRKNKQIKKNDEDVIYSVREQNKQKEQDEQKNRSKRKKQRNKEKQMQKKNKNKKYHKESLYSQYSEHPYNAKNGFTPEDINAAISCELVAISKGAFHQSEGYYVPPAFRSYECLEYYNVLWIEWEDGIASRKGVGLVFKDAWEAQELEAIDLILGWVVLLGHCYTEASKLSMERANFLTFDHNHGMKRNIGKIVTGQLNEVLSQDQLRNCRQCPSHQHLDDQQQYGCGPAT